MEKSETKLDIEEPPGEQKTSNKSKTVYLADSVSELHADGDVSEAESNCSSVSGLQTPFIRITRRRKIVVPCQPETPAKNRQSKKALPNERSKCQDDDDISEAESCSSTVSGVRTPSVLRTARRQQVWTNISPVCEAQTEEVSDAESWCSGISLEPSVKFQRMTRSMRLKLQAETSSQSERKSEVVVDDAKSPEYAAGSQTIVISDSEQPTKSHLDAEQSSSLSSDQVNEQLSSCKTKCHSRSDTSNELTRTSSSSPEKVMSECAKKSPKKEAPKKENYEAVGNVELKAEMDKDARESDTQQILAAVYEVAESPEEICNQAITESTNVMEIQLPIKSTDICPYDHRRSDQSNESPKQTTPSKNKRNLKPQRQSFLHHIGEIIDVDEPSEVGHLQNTIPSQTIDSSDEDDRVSLASINSDGSSEQPVAKSSFTAAKTMRHDRCPTVSLLTSDETDESENSDVEEMNAMETTASRTDTSNQRASAVGKSQDGGVFVIDKTPGLDPSKAYYLEEEEEAVTDEQSEESSELEDNEEAFIDEAEDMLNVNNKILSLSSSIDPGLDVKQLGGLYISFDAGKQKPRSHGVVSLKEKKKDELLKKSIITADFEKKECIPPLRESAYQLKKQRRAEREKTTGDGWFGMKAPEMTDELKNDLKALKMRAAIDPKRFYKKNDREGLPKYFQVGTVVDSPVDFYHARIPKKERKKNIVEELLADSEFRRYNKRKYQDIIAEKAALAAGKKNRKKKKFRNNV
ncbi:deoxynucleotidyltransferase terminal-interacting protein 2 isoform X2 [Varanus komodoensis]|nr:deoxynucleotidyltransferase terminal-interacting protein 2 isoform X2 [Varanus komodoensis]